MRVAKLRSIAGLGSRLFWPTTIGLALCLIAFQAQAHVGVSTTSGFRSGFTHPLTGLDHFLAMFAVGVWGAQIGGRQVWTLPTVFPLVMVIGGLLALAGVPLGDVEIGIAVSIVALGLAVAVAWRPPEAVAIALIAVFAVCHGYAHGTELPEAATPSAFAVGFVVATGLIHVIGIGAGMAIVRVGRRLNQGLGAAIAVAGLYYLIG